MIPLWSRERTYSPAIVTLLIIAMNIAVFLLELSLSPGGRDRFMVHYGIVPDRFHASTLLTSMFLHGGFMHIAGNMWFLWVFGKGIEDSLGHARYLTFYLLCGLAAGFAQFLMNPNSPVPTIGASGAIAGVMGAYAIKFPRAQIRTLLIVVIFITTVDIPAIFYLLYWFFLQFFHGFGSIGYSTVSRGEVAWFAHVGGFLAGIALVSLMPTRQRAYRY